MVKYVYVEWPEVQKYMEHERAEECLCVLMESIDVPAYMVPEDLYEELSEKQ